MPAASPSPSEPATTRLCLLATTDLHCHVTGFDYIRDRPAPDRGLTRIATLIDAIREEARDTGAEVLLFDNGDAFQGSPIGTFYNDPDASPGPHPLMRAYAHLGYDAIGLGNHDFNAGIPVLERILNDAPCPVLSANLIRHSAQVLPMVRPATVLTPANGLRIGVFSVLPPQTALWDAELLQGALDTGDILSSARAQITALQAERCDVIVALAHTGLGEARDQSGLENAAIPLAALPGLDAIFAGHTHLTLPGDDHAGYPATDAIRGDVHGKPVAMAGHSGQHLARIDLTLKRNATGKWQMVEQKAALLSVSGACPPVPEQQGLRQLLNPIHTETRQRLATPIGQTAQHLHSYFSLVRPDRVQHLTATLQAQAVRPYLAGTGLERLPLLSATSPVRFGGRGGPGDFTDLPAGQVRQRHLKDLFPFPNRVQAIILTGARIRDWLETAASVFSRIAPGSAETELLNPDWAGHSLDTLFGLSYRIDLTQNARFTPDGRLADASAYRITNLFFGQQPLADDARCIVALNNYRADGGGNVTALIDAERVPLPGTSIRRLFQRHLTHGTAPTTAATYAQRPWSFTPIPTARVLLHSAPQAQALLSELAEHDAKDEGQNAQGFLRISLTP